MSKFFGLLTLIGLAGCYRVDDQIAPAIAYHLQERHLSSLSPSFKPLSPEERATDWGRELLIAKAFAKELDLYRAISTYKRAAILMPPEQLQRKMEAEYGSLFCYYLGARYDEAVECFEKSSLATADKAFESHHDLLLILHECYHEMDNSDKQDWMGEMIRTSYPETAERLKVSHALRAGDLPAVRTLNHELPHPSYLDPLITHYDAYKKSVGKAQLFNALLPGAGYLYIGQKKSALTAFLLNGLFIAAAYQFFHRGHTAAGIITTSFEAGWYFGGIYGAGEEAKYYNERLYETSASTVLNEKHLFTPLMLRYAF